MGFRGTKSLFWFAIRNPVYCGKIFIAKYKDEECRFVKGLHEPLISENLYYQVQDVLDGRKRHYRLKVASNATLPLRGFLLCPKCKKILTGSASKGQTKHYSYYHCSVGCNFRHRADDANHQFFRELKKYILRSEMAELYKIVLQEAWHSQTAHLQDDRKQLLKQINEFEEKLSYVRDLLASKQIEPEDFREMKSEYSNKLEKLKAKLNSGNNDIVNIKSLLDTGIDGLLKLDDIYENADIDKKREVISSLFPEKLHFENNSLRTGRVNEAVRLIYLISNEFNENKKGQNGFNPILSSQVGAAR